MGSILGAVAGPVIGSVISGNSAKDAAGEQADAANNAAALQKYIFDMQNGQQAPYRQAGYGGLSNLAYLLGAGPKEGLSGPDSTGANTTFAPNTDLGAYGSLLKPFGASDFQEDPGYQFRMGEGQKALERSAASRGTLLSGAGLKAITDYGQNFASNEYQNAYNRYNTNQTNEYNRLAGLAGIGQTANAATGQAAQNYANQAGQYMTQAGSAQAAGTLGQGTAWSTGLSNLGNYFGNSGGGNTYQNGQSFNGQPINWNR